MAGLGGLGNFGFNLEEIMRNLPGIIGGAGNTPVRLPTAVPVTSPGGQTLDPRDQRTFFFDDPQGGNFLRPEARDLILQNNAGAPVRSTFGKLGRAVHREFEGGSRDPQDTSFGPVTGGETPSSAPTTPLGPGVFRDRTSQLPKNLGDFQQFLPSGLFDFI